MKKKVRKLFLHRETLRALTPSNLNRVAGNAGEASAVAACISAALTKCTTWGNSDCGDCNSQVSNCDRC